MNAYLRATMPPGSRPVGAEELEAFFRSAYDVHYDLYGAEYNDHEWSRGMRGDGSFPYYCTTRKPGWWYATHEVL